MKNHIFSLAKESSPNQENMEWKRETGNIHLKWEFSG